MQQGQRYRCKNAPKRSILNKMAALAMGEDLLHPGVNEGIMEVGGLSKVTFLKDASFN